MEKNFTFAGAVEVHARPEDNLFLVMISEYERVLVSSLITTFGLDFIVKDQHGGDVDTIHNVRQIDKDPLMTYKNAKNQADYDNRDAYDSKVYHDNNAAYRQSKINSKRAERSGQPMSDSYEGKPITHNKHAPPSVKASLDHIKSAKEIHDDRGRVLAGLDGADLANDPTNLTFTNGSLNSSMRADSIPDYIKAHPELDEATKARMMEKYEQSKAAYEKRVAYAYYTSSKFAKDLGTAAAKTGGKMAVRQALGFVFTEIWFAVKEELALVDDNADLPIVLEAIGRGIQRGFEQSKVKYKELFDTTLSGGIAGALASVTTTLCNIFFTTAKNTVRLIRQSWVYLVDATKVLYLNPDDYLFGQRIQEAAKIVAVGASMVAGVLLQEALQGTGLGAIPVVGDLVSTFCGALVSGLLSCTFLIYLDRSKEIKALVATLNHVPTISTVTHYYRQEAQNFMVYAAQMQDMDINAFTAEVALYETAVKAISSDTTPTELNAILHTLMETLNIKTPWVGDFDSFMGDGTNRLVFE